MVGIQQCDLFVAYLGLDFASAYGTMSEIGAAHAWGKQILLVVHPELDTEDFWFLITMANVVTSDNPVEAVRSFLSSKAQVTSKVTPKVSRQPRMSNGDAMTLTVADRKFLQGMKIGL